MPSSETKPLLPLLKKVEVASGSLALSVILGHAYRFFQDAENIFPDDAIVDERECRLDILLNFLV